MLFLLVIASALTGVPVLYRIYDGRVEAVNPQQSGTKAAALYRLEVEAGGSAVLDSGLRPWPW